jgi:hypothetical protein
MKVIRTRTKKDGSLSVTLDVTEEERSMLLFEGIKAFVAEENVKLMVLPCTGNEETYKDAKQIELTDEQSHFFIEIGFSSILRKSLALYEKESSK